MRLLTLRGLGGALRQARDTRAGALVPELSADSLRRLGALLERVTDGEDARTVFSQPRRARGQPDKRARDTRAVFDYWRHRVAHPADAAGALAIVCERYDLSKGTARRLARKHRDETLWALEAPFARWEGDRLVRGRRGLDTHELRAYLARKSKGGNRPK